jgi:hypothetical protein
MKITVTNTTSGFSVLRSDNGFQWHQILQTKNPAHVFVIVNAYCSIGYTLEFKEPLTIS